MSHTHAHTCTHILQVDNQLLIDQWSSLVILHASATIVFEAPMGYHQLVIEYKQEWGSSGCSLKWFGAPYSLARFESLKTSPLLLAVVAGKLDLARSKLYGSALTLATACMAAQFTVMARDIYGNAAQIHQSERNKWEIYVIPAGFTGWHITTLAKAGNAFSGDVSCSEEAHGCTVQYRTTASGRYVLLVRVKTSEGMLHISGSPSEVVVLPGIMNVRFSQAFGDGLTLSTAGITAQFVILARDCANTSVPTLTEGASLYQFEMQDEAGMRIAAHLSAQAFGDGVYASIYCTTSGLYFLSVRTPAGNLRGSPYPFKCLPAYPSAKKSLLHSDVLTVATAGSESHFKLILRDSFGNLASNYPCAIQILQTESGNSINSDWTKSLGAQTGSCAMAWMRTASGRYLIRVGYLQEGGLTNTYYTGLNFSNPIASFTSSTINISSSMTSFDSASLGSYNTTSSVRWIGFIKPSLSQIYTFTAAVASRHERIKLWVDDRLVLDQWTSLINIQLSVTFSFGAIGVYYPISMEYTRDTSGTEWGTRLEWQGSSPLGTTNVGYQSFFLIAGPLVAEVVSANLDGPSCSAQGHALTIMTAGKPSSFLVLGRDIYGNRASSVNLRMQVSVASNLDPIPILSTISLGPGQWNVTLSGTTTSGMFALDVGIFESQGLWATYYKDPFFREATVVKTDLRIDFSWGPSRPVHGVPKDYFSVRWSGWISARYTEPHLLYLYGAVDPDIWQEAPDCARYIVGDKVRYIRNDSMAIAAALNRSILNLCQLSGVREYGMWERPFHFDAHHMYSLDIEYKASVGNAGCKLRWSSANEMPDFVPSEFLHRFSLFRGSPSWVNVVERKVDNPQACHATGSGLTLVTAGLFTAFTVLCSDEYGNNLRERNDLVAHIRNIESLPSSTYLPSIINTRHVFRYVLTTAAHYNVELFNVQEGFLSATYYDAAFFHPSYARYSAVLAAHSTHMGRDIPTKVALTRPFGVRWAGFLQVAPAQTLTFYLNLQNCDERIKMWVDNVLLVDQWSSVASSSNFSIRPESSANRSIHEFRLQYSSSSSVWGGLNLTWASSPTSNTPVDHNIFLAADSATGRSSHLFSMSGVAIEIQPSVFCASNSRVVGSGLSSGTVGRTSTFNVLLRDEYSNPAITLNSLGLPQFLVSSMSPPLLLKGKTNHLGDIGLYSISYPIVTSYAGTYPNVSVLHLRPGLQATFYNVTASDLIMESQNIGSMPFSTDFSRSVDTQQIMPHINSSYFVRWSGFIRASFTQIYTLHAELAESDERVKLWVDNKLILDQWSSLAGTQPLGTIQFLNAGYYDIAIEYRQLKGASGFRLKGKGIVALEDRIEWVDPDHTPHVVPQSDLFHGSRISNQTFSLSLHPGTADVTYTTLAGSFLTLTTAGVSSIFTINARDIGGSQIDTNSTTGFEVLGVLEWFGPFEDDRDRTRYQLRSQVSWHEDVVNNLRAFSYGLTLSGQYICAISLHARGGLSATYWDNMHQGFLNDMSASVRIDPVIAFQWNVSNPIISDGLASVNSYASVKWDAFVLPEFSELYTLILTFEADVLRRDGRYCASCHDMAQVFVNDIQHIATDTQVWTVKDASVHKHYSSVKFTKGVLQHLKIVMRHYEGDANLKLEWTSLSTPCAIIPSLRLYHYVDSLRLGPIRLLVRSGIRNASKSSIEVDGHSMTAGLVASFHIKSFDAFGNPAQTSALDTGTTILFLRTVDAQSASIQANVSNVLNTNVELAVVKTTRAALTEAYALFAYSGGLYATYNFSHSSPKLQINRILNTSLPGTELSHISSLPVNESFNIRYSGFIRPSLAASYTIYAAITEPDERVKLWVDNKLIIDQWSSLESTEAVGTMGFGRANGFYEVIMEYKQAVVQDNAVFGAMLSWLRPNWSQKQTIASNDLWFGNHIGDSPLELHTLPNTISTASSASGMGLTLASSGVAASFTITSTDDYGNQATFDMSPFTPHLSCNISSPLTPARTLLSAGIEQITYITSFSRNICKLGVLLHGQHISGSPWTLFTALGPTSAALSTVQIARLSTVMTAGVYLQISLMSRDVFNVLKPAIGDRFIAVFYAPLHRNPAHVFSFNSSTGLEYSAQMLLTISGNYSVYIGKVLAAGTGLRAQYFGLSTLQALLAESVASPNFIGSPHPRIGLSQAFSARWKGFVRTPPTREYRVRLQLSAVQDRVRMWINSAMVMDQWTSLASLYPTTSGTTLSDEIDSFRHFEIEYAHPYGTASMALHFLHGNYTIFDTPDDNLYAELEQISNSPFQWTVIPAPAVFLTAAGHGLSLGTVGLMSTFSILSSDRYGNLRDEWNDEMVVMLAGNNSTTANIFIHPDFTSSKSGASYAVSYLAPTLAGYHYMYAFCANSGGMQATYYSDSDLSISTNNAIDTLIDFSGPPSATHPDLLSTLQSWGVRWQGFVRPSLAQAYTMHTVVSEVDERVKLWVDNRLVIDQWSSLAAIGPKGTVIFGIVGGFYQVSMEYKKMSGVNYGVALKWSSGNNIIQEPVTKMWWNGVVMNSPFRISILTVGGGSGGATDTSESIRGFVGNSVDATFTAGDTVSFRLQTQDAFGNDLSFNCQEMPGDFCPQIPFDVFLDGRTSPSETSVQMRADRLYKAGYAFYRFTPTVSGTYDLQIHLLRQNSVQIRSYRQFNGNLDIVSSFKTVISTGSEDCPTQTKFHFSGFFFVEQTGLIMFQLKATQLAQFYIERQLITSFSSGSAGESTGEIFLSSDRPYEFSMQTQACSYDHKPAEILWRFDSNAPFAPIPQSRLFYKTDELSKNRFTVKVQPSEFCSSCSQAEGHGLTLAVASVQTSFTIFAKDEYCNMLANQDPSTFVVRVLRADSLVQFWNAISTQVDGRYPVQYTTQYPHGIYDLHVSHVKPGFVMATYYSIHSSIARQTFAQDSSIDFSAAHSSSVPQPSISANSSFSVRFSGFVQPALAQEYTFYTSVSETDERMKLWIESKLLIDQWTSLDSTEAWGTVIFGEASGYYQVTMEYKQNYGDMGVHLKWESTSVSKSVISSSHLWKLSDLHHSLLRIQTMWNTSIAFTELAKIPVPTKQLSVSGGASITVLGFGFNTSAQYTCIFVGRDYSAALPVTAFNTTAIVCYTPPWYGDGSDVDFTLQVEGVAPKWSQLTAKFRLQGLLMSICLLAAVCCSVLHCDAVRCSVLQCAVVCCSVLQFATIVNACTSCRHGFATFGLCGGWQHFVVILHSNFAVVGW